MRNLKFLIVPIILFSSCKKEGLQNEEVKLTYMPLSIGNYWVYQQYKIDTSGTETLLKQVDSVIVTRDTTIRDQKYYILEGTRNPFIQQWGVVNILRDSSGYLVSNNGNILFAENNFIDTLRKKIEKSNDGETIFTVTAKMEETTNKIQVPAGTFDVLNYRKTVIVSDNFTKLEYPRYQNNYYAKDVGEILDTYFYVSSYDYIEKRLIKYYVQIE